ncbi:hypothetical protein [Candidatus Uabimicrobium sp. HlEnr_7]|uniref:hypothetical protein n=1 Tax=Candidatus Uabimicrobium helgolandensis TaxID=3095367 RepID=UPI00355678DB
MRILQKTLDNTLVDIQHIKNEKAQGTILLWPCGMGDIHSSLYENYRDIFKDFDLILYNPRAHGNSHGYYCFEQAVKDAIYFTKNMEIRLPLYGIGHSAGGTGILKLANILPFQKLFLFSPVLDSRQALEFMYKEKYQYLFTKLFCGERKYNPKLWDVLIEGKWLDIDYWEKIKDSIDNKTSSYLSIKKSMESVAHPGYNVSTEIAQHREKILTFIPEKDLWFSIDTQLSTAKSLGITIASIHKARNHFFKRRWNGIWTLLLQIINDKASYE